MHDKQPNVIDFDIKHIIQPYTHDIQPRLQPHMQLQNV